MINFWQLSAVIGDSGNVNELETSTPELAFASYLWTYMTSHILVRRATDHFRFCHLLIDMSQGMYPLIVVILVHSQKSYIEEATINIPQSKDIPTVEDEAKETNRFTSIRRTVRNSRAGAQALDLESMGSTEWSGSLE